MEEEPRSEAPSKGLYASVMDRYGASVITTITDPCDELYEFELSLRRLRQVKDEGLKKIGGENWRPLMNEDGINDIMTAMRSVINSMSAFSNYEDTCIQFLYDNLRENMIGLMLFNRVKYGVARHDRDMIVGDVCRFSYSFMRRAFHEGDKRFFKGTVVETRHTEQLEKNKGGFLPFNMFNKNN